MLHQIRRAVKLPDSIHQHGKQALARQRKRSVATRPALESLESRRLLADILGSAAAFAALGASTVTNTGATALVGSVGVSPGTAITGFPPGVVSGGAIHAGDATATQAEANLATAYADIAGEAVNTNLTGQNLGGLTLTAGVYHFDTSAQLTGTLTFNALGNPNARFDVQIGTTLTTATDSAIVLINGAQADNVYFQVGSSATLGTRTAFQGNILADTSVTLDSNATLSPGRALAINGAVTMDTNQVAVPEADVSITDTTASGTVNAGKTATYTVTVANAGPSEALTVSMSDVLSADTTFVSETQTSGPTFTMSNPAAGANGTITGTINALASGASARFTIVARVSPGTPYATSIHNSATATADTFDPSMANNSDSVSSSVGPELTLASKKSPLTTTSIRPALSILGADTSSQGEAGLTYTWSVARAPSGAKPAKFSINGTHSARNATIRVEKAGTYALNCLITDNYGNSLTVPVELVIEQAATSLRLTPHAQTLAAGATLQYGASVMDQFAHPMRTKSAITYAVKFGRGTINNTGLFTAGAFQSHIVIQMTEDQLTGVLGATIL